MSDLLIRVDQVSKKFCWSLRRSLWYGLADLGGELIGRRRAGRGELRQQEFWAVRGAGFELRRGECIGLVGHNGAGKTTLLRMLNGLIRPDSGSIHIRGRVGALIALGAGFHPLLTGRENIHVNASVLGFSRAEIERRFDEIVDFSGLAEHLDSPVQNYSSGMNVRLGFAIAAHIEPDVLLVDEALAVGDVAFTVRCLNRIAALRRSGTGVIFVSHNELQVRTAATRCIVMSKGDIIHDGGLDEGFFAYDLSREKPGEPADPDSGFVHQGAVRMGECTLVADGSSNGLRAGGPLRVVVHCLSDTDVRDAGLLLRFWNGAGQLVTSFDSEAQNHRVNLPPGPSVLTVDIPSFPGVPGRYRLAGGIRRHGEYLGWARDLAHFTLDLPGDIRLSEGGFFVTRAAVRLSAGASGAA